MKEYKVIEIDSPTENLKVYNGLYYIFQQIGHTLYVGKITNSGSPSKLKNGQLNITSIEADSGLIKETDLTIKF